MPFPAGLTMISVHCRFDLPPSGGATGTVRFASPVPLVGATDDSVVPRFTLSGSLAADGTCTVSLPATNDPEWVPAGWAYDVLAAVGADVIRGTLQLDYQTVSVELADLLQVDGAATVGVSYIPLSQKGAANGVASLDGAGDVLLAQIPSLAALYLSTAGGEVVGDVVVQDAATATKGYRLKTSGSSLDLDASGADLFLSNFSAADFDGTQRIYLRLESGTQLAHAVGRWLVADGPFAGSGVADLDGSTGVAGLGAKNSLGNIPLVGRRTTSGPPATGAWATGEVVQSTDGWWQCVASGTPGTWTPLGPGARPSEHGLAGWTFDTAMVQAGTLMPTAGLAQMARIQVLSSTVSAINFHFTAGGSSLTAGQCFAALYNDAGALLGAGAVTGDQAANWATGGFKTCALSVAQGVMAGAYYRILWWFNGTTGPTLSRAVNSSSAILNAGLAAPNFRYATADAGLTTSAPANIGTQTGGATAWWVGVTP